MLKYEIYTTNGLPTIGGENTKKLSFSTPDKGSAISISTTTTENDIEIDEYCLCGHLKVFKVLPKIAWICLLFDAIFAILTVQSSMAYTFIPLFLSSLIILYTTSRGVRKELKELVRFGIYIMFIKLMCLVLFIIGAIAYLKDLGIRNIFNKYGQENDKFIYLLIVLSVHLLTLLIQFYLTYCAIEIIRKRDLIYVIPAAPGSIRMRPNLQLVVERLKNQNLGVQIF